VTNVQNDLAIDAGRTTCAFGHVAMINGAAAMIDCPLVALAARLGRHSLTAGMPVLVEISMIEDARRRDRGFSPSIQEHE